MTTVVFDNSVLILLDARKNIPGHKTITHPSNCLYSLLPTNGLSSPKYEYLTSNEENNFTLVFLTELSIRSNNPLAIWCSENQDCIRDKF